MSVVCARKSAVSQPTRPPPNDDDVAGQRGLVAGQDVPGRDDIVSVDSLECFRDHGRGPGGHDKHIRLELVDEFRGDFLAQLHLHARLLHLRGKVLDQLADLLHEGGDTGDIDLTAQLLFLLTEGHLVPSEGRNTGRFQSGRASAGDQDLLRFVDGDESHLPLFPAAGFTMQVACWPLHTVPIHPMLQAMQGAMSSRLPARPCSASQGRRGAPVPWTPCPPCRSR